MYHHYQTGLLNATLCHYDDVQVHVSNNASVCTSVSQWERMHVHALCVSCKEIATRNHCNRSRGRIKTRILARIMANWKALYMTRGLCECVANSLTPCRVLPWEMQDYCNPGPSRVNLVRSSCKVRSPLLFFFS